VYAIVPVKNLGASKQRLSEIFNPQERTLLTIAMLEDVLSALKKSVVDKVVVVGENSEVNQEAKKFGAYYLSGCQVGLNPAVEEASTWCADKGASSILVLPADIPLVTAQDINQIIDPRFGEPLVVLSPSQNWGTNALYQNPPKLIPACFGPKSFMNQIKEAYIRKALVRVHFSTEFATDIDSVIDLKILLKAETDSACKRVLEQITRDNSRHSLLRQIRHGVKNNKAKRVLTS